MTQTLSSSPCQPFDPDPNLYLNNNNNNDNNDNSTSHFNNNNNNHNHHVNHDADDLSANDPMDLPPPASPTITAVSCTPMDMSDNHHDDGKIMEEPTVNTSPSLSASSPSAPLCGFEGPEKRLEIQFSYDPSFPVSSSSSASPFLRCRGGSGGGGGLLNVSAAQWQSQVLDKARCTIISSTCNQHFNSFVLSESSLFVYPTTVMIKTCGTTALLNAVDPILRIAREHGMSVQFMVYSRKNFVFPENQPAPHKNFDMEVAALDKYFDGSGYIIGPLTGDHWHMYIADYGSGNGTNGNTAVGNVNTSDHEEEEGGHISSPPSSLISARASGITVEVLMHDLSPAKMSQFFKQHGVSAKDVTHSSKIDTILPGSVIDAFQFDPCGYSMNGLLGSAYWTIHITPEQGFSYVSFETNITAEQLFENNSQDSYADMLARVLHVFEPGRFTITLFSDDYDTQRDTLHQLTKVWMNKEKDFKLHSKCTTEFPEEGYALTWCCFTQRLFSAVSPPKSSSGAASIKRCQSALF